MRAGVNSCPRGVLAAACMLLVGGEARAAPPDLVHVAPQHAAVGPGETVQFRAMPPDDVPPASVSRTEPSAVLPPHPAPRTRWSVASGPGSVSSSGLYRAPYVVPAPGAVALVRATRGPRNSSVSSDASIQIGPGTYRGAEDCLGENQRWSTAGTGVDYEMVDELPEAIVRVTPEYPASARARDLAGNLVVNVIVCRSGHVLDAYATWPVGATAISELEQLALEAAREWVFKPAMLQGRPIAVTVAIPFRFPPP